MPILILGLVIFLGAHSLRIFAEGWRKRMIARLGLKPWKAVYSLISLLGLVLLVWGFGQVRQNPVLLYTTPAWLAQLNALWTLIAFVLLASSHAPPTHWKAWLHHPMAAGVIVWAAGHLLSIGFLHDVVLFGASLAWGVVDFLAARARDRKTGTVYAPGTLRADIVSIVIGAILWALFAFWLHGWLIGVKPFG